jgi:hypothetical protein
MYFNSDKEFDAEKEAKSLISEYFRIIYEDTLYSRPSNAFRAAKRCALREIEVTIPIILKYAGSELNHFNLILNELKILNKDLKPISYASH